MLLPVLWLGPFVLTGLWAMFVANRFWDAYGKRYGGILTRRESLERFLNDPTFPYAAGARDTVAGWRALFRRVDDPEIEALRRQARRAIALTALWLFCGWLLVAVVIRSLDLPTELDPAVAGWLERYVPVLFYLGMVVGWIALLVYWLRRPARPWWWLVRLLGLAWFAIYILSLLTRPPI